MGYRGGPTRPTQPIVKQFVVAETDVVRLSTGSSLQAPTDKILRSQIKERTTMGKRITNWSETKPVNRTSDG